MYGAVSHILLGALQEKCSGFLTPTLVKVLMRLLQLSAYGQSSKRFHKEFA